MEENQESNQNLFSKGYISDYGVFSRIQANHYSISKIRRLRFSTRLVKSRNDLNIVKRANRGFKLAIILVVLVEEFLCLA